MYYYKELSWQLATVTEKHKKNREKKFTFISLLKAFLQQLHEMEINI